MNQGECSNDFRFSTVFVTAKFVRRATDRYEAAIVSDLQKQKLQFISVLRSVLFRSRGGIATEVALLCTYTKCTFGCRSEFYREAHVLVHLRDPNIIRLIGICTKTEPYFLIYEFLPHGDLCQFLQSCLPLESLSNSDQQNRSLRYQHNSSTIWELFTDCYLAVNSQQRLLLIFGRNFIFTLPYFECLSLFEYIKCVIQYQYFCTFSALNLV